jgi:O-antigen/teichoic acid export membrane protein
MTSNQQGIITRFLSHMNPIVKRNAYLSRVIEFVSRNPLYKGLFILGSGTAVAQLVGIASMPIITRLYAPSDLGILAVYSSILAIVGISATLRYEYAYALPKQDAGAASLFGLCLILLFSTTIIFALILFFGWNLLSSAFDLSSIEQYIWLLPAGFFGMGFYSILNLWAIRQRDYKRITCTRINQGIGGAMCKIILGILSLGPMGLIIGHLVSQIAGVGTFAHAIWKKERENLKRISLSDMRDVAKEYKGFPAFNFPASVLHALSLHLPPIMLLALYDSQVVGFYALAHMVMVLPVSAIQSSMQQAYLGEASKMVREGSRELRSLYVKTVRHLSMIGIPLISIPALCAPFIIPIVFGEAWVEAGWYCLPLVLAVTPQFIVTSTSKLEIYGYTHWMLMANIIRSVCVLIGFYICQMLGLPVLITLTIYASILLLNYIMLSMLNLKAISKFTSRLDYRA